MSLCLSDTVEGLQADVLLRHISQRELCLLVEHFRDGLEDIRIGWCIVGLRDDNILIVRGFDTDVQG